jgi:hypothetical protein
MNSDLKKARACAVGISNDLRFTELSFKEKALDGEVIP